MERRIKLDFPCNKGIGEAIERIKEFQLRQVFAKVVGCKIKAMLVFETTLREVGDAPSFSLREMNRLLIGSRLDHVLYA